MNINIERSEFHKAITKVEGIISAREIRSVLSNILIETAENKITLTTTDLEMGIKTSVSAEIVKPGKITLPAKKLSQAVREFRSSSINLEADENFKINIQDKDRKSAARISLMGASSEEYPVIPTLPDNAFRKFPSALISEMIRKTSYSMAEEDARYVFNGLYIINKGTAVSFVGTDGRRLSRVEREFPEDLPFQDGIILPNKAVRELQKLLDNEDGGTIAYEEKDRRIHFRLGEVVLIAKLIEGQYPDYQQVIPKKLGEKLNLDRARLESSLRQVAVMAAEPSRQVRLSFQSGSLNISSSTPDLGEAQDSMETSYEGEELTIAFNSNYIMDIIKTLTGEEVQVSFTSSNAPAVLLDPQDKSFIAVIMPMKI